MTKPITIRADEVNCLIYSYLRDSGFDHTAFALCTEGRLEHSPLFHKHIPRGELVELLSRALLYNEIEAHWKGDLMTTNCKNSFSIIEPHVCELDPALQPEARPFPVEDVISQNGDVQTDGAMKRKADEAGEGENGRAEKRSRTEELVERMQVDIASTEQARIEEQDQEKNKEPDPRMSSEAEAPAPPVPHQDILSESASKLKVRRASGPSDEVTDPNAIQLLKGHKTEVFVCAWNPVKIGILATGSKDAIVHIWDLSTPGMDGDQIPQYTKPPITLAHMPKAEAGDLTSLDWNSDGSLLAIGSYDAILRVCTASGELYFTHTQHTGPIFATRFSKSGQWLLTASLDGTACVWDIKAKSLYTQYRSHTDCCLDVDWLDERTFASCGADKMIHIMRLDQAKPIKTLSGHTNEVNQIKCNPSRTRLASCSDDRTARIWDVESVSSPTSAGSDPIPGLSMSSADRVVILKGHKNNVSSIGWCPVPTGGQHELLATSGFDGTSRLWDSVTGDCIKVFADHKRPVYALSFSPEGRWLATGSGDGWLHVYDVKDMEKKWSWYAGSDKPGIYEIDWQLSGNIHRIAFALESRNVGVVDVTRIPALQLD